jgi:hypothetical protein
MVSTFLYRGARIKAKNIDYEEIDKKANLL